MECGRQGETTTLKIGRYLKLYEVWTMSLSVNESGVKTFPQSDLREGITKRQNGKRKKDKDDLIKIGTWNVRSLLQAGKLENAKQEMERNRLDILGMSEVRWGGSGEIESGEYRMYYSGQEVKGMYGVGVLINRRMKGKVLKVEYINERIMTLRLEGKQKDLVIIQIYMPTGAHEDEEVEECYERIEEIMKREGKNACVMIMGDCNAVVGEGGEGSEVGKYGLGKRNERGQRLVEFCIENKLVIGNTIFENHKRRRYTWTSNFNEERYQIDYIMIQQRFKNSIKNARSYPGADINSDHNLVVAEINIKMKKTTKGKERLVMDIEKIKNIETAKKVEELFVDKMNKMEIQEDDIEKRWESMKDSMKEAMKAVMGTKVRKRIRKGWITGEMLDKMEERRRWKNTKSEEGKRKYRRLNNELRRETERARDLWLREKCNMIETLQKEGKFDLMYREAKELIFTEKKTSGITLETEGGETVCETKEVLNRWKEYVENLFKWENRPKEEDMEVEEECEVLEDQRGFEILEREIEISIKEMKNSKATGGDEIPAEILKAMNGDGKRMVMSLCKYIYELGKWPKDFTETIMIPIPKKKNAKRCEEYRTINLISHTAKVLLRTINRRLYGRLNEMMKEEQYGFRKGMGTRDAIGLLRVIGERYIEKGKKVYVVFIDLEKAFDRVQWSKLMRILKKCGIEWKERRLIKELYLNQSAKVKIRGENSEEIGLGRGVRQGCCLSPTLFNIYLEEIIGECFEGRRGVNMGGRRVECIRFADDMAVLAESEEDLRKMVKDLDCSCEKYGMKINIKKTKSMILGGEEETIRIILRGEEIEQVEKYRYLGSWCTRDMRCTTEVKTRIAMAKEGFNKRRRLLCGPLQKELRKKLVKCYIWSVLLYGAETWTLRKEDIKRLESMEMWLWRRMEGVRWVERVTNEEVLARVGEERQLVNVIKKRKRNWLGHIMRKEESLLRTAMEGMVEGKRKRGRRRYKLIDDIKWGRGYCDTKEVAQNRKRWKNTS